MALSKLEEKPMNTSRALMEAMMTAPTPAPTTLPTPPDRLMPPSTQAATAFIS